MAEPEYPIEDYATAWPQTAQPTAPEPDEDPGHLVPDDVWATVRADVEGQAVTRWLWQGNRPRWIPLSMWQRAFAAGYEAALEDIRRGLTTAPEANQ